MRTNWHVVLWSALWLPGSAFGPSRLSFAEPRREAPRPETTEVREIVRLLEARYHSAATWKANFLERYSEGRRAVRVESGIVYFSRPGRMRWEYEAPEEKLFLVDGKTVWFYVPADRTVTRAPMKESADWRTPLALLTRKARLSRFCSRIELLDQATASRQQVVLRCLPKAVLQSVARDPASEARAAPTVDDDFQEALLEVNAGNGELARVVIRRAGGIEIEYRFGNWRRNLQLSEALFHFQAPPGVAIVDQASLDGSSR